jgi:excisionase family DNA binding protein
MTVEIPGMAEAAERLGITTRQIVQLVYDREIRYVIVDGIPRIPEDAIDEYRRKAS